MYIFCKGNSHRLTLDPVLESVTKDPSTATSMIETHPLLLLEWHILSRQQSPRPINSDLFLSPVESQPNQGISFLSIIPLNIQKNRVVTPVFFNKITTNHCIYKMKVKMDDLVGLDGVSTELKHCGDSHLHMYVITGLTCFSYRFILSGISSGSNVDFARTVLA